MYTKPKEHLPDWAQCQEAIGGIYFTKEALQPGLEIGNFEPGLKVVCVIVFSGWTALFLVVVAGSQRFLKDGFKTYLMTRCNNTNFFHRHIDSLWPVAPDEGDSFPQCTCDWRLTWCHSYTNQPVTLPIIKICFRNLTNDHQALNNFMSQGYVWFTCVRIRSFRCTKMQLVKDK